MTKEEALKIATGLRTDFKCESDIMVDFCNTIIKALQQEPKIGHWIKEETIYGWDGHSYQCSICGRSIHLDTAFEDLTDYPYCHCGAYMIESEDKNA